MKNKQFPPIPFLILILAGVVSLVSIAADRNSHASMLREDPVQMQTVEQERLAAVYFRVLSWISDVIPRSEEPAKAHPRSAPAPQVVKSPHRTALKCNIELCAFRYMRDLAASNRSARHLN
jgi:hypothetical protein